MKTRPQVLTIGGFDPSAGAGVLADVKTFEQCKVYGLAVNTANTVQTGSDFVSVNWLDEALIWEQLKLLKSAYKIRFIKMGLIPSFEWIKKVADLFSENDPIIVVDPILKTSSGFDIDHEIPKLIHNFSYCSYLTPNWNEVKLLAQEEDAYKAAQDLVKWCNIYLKGGHSKDRVGKDYLFTKGAVKTLSPKGSCVSEKHGSGCVFSAALLAYLSLGYPELKACLKAKQYVTRFLESNKTLLGFHK